MEDPVSILSSILISLNISEFQIINSSANLDICIAHIEAEDKKSKTKSLSEIESIELAVGFLKPNFLEVKFLSILYDVPAKAPAPRGHSSRYSILLINLFCLF